MNSGVVIDIDYIMYIYIYISCSRFTNFVNYIFDLIISKGDSRIMRLASCSKLCSNDKDEFEIATKIGHRVYYEENAPICAVAQNFIFNDVGDYFDVIGRFRYFVTLS
jgi:hypothetical protein